MTSLKNKNRVMALHACKRLKMYEQKVPFVM